MAKARRRVRWIVAGAVVLAALVPNPMFGVFSGPRFGAAALRAAVEGTWRLTVDDAGATRTVTFRIAQGTEADAAEVERAEHVGLVRSAGACGHRSLVRSAGACRDWTSMPLEVTLISSSLHHLRVPTQYLFPRVPMRFAEPWRSRDCGRAT